MVDGGISIFEVFKQENVKETMPEEEILSVKITPFDFIKSVSETKENIFSETTEKEYNPFLINRGFSYFADTVLYANEMNKFPEIPKKSQFEYYTESLRRRKRYSKWFKAEKDEDLLLIQNTYNVRPEIAKQYKKILTKDQLDYLRSKSETGGSNSKIK